MRVVLSSREAMLAEEKTCLFARLHKRAKNMLPHTHVTDRYS
jgi:hypothetical protein